MRILPKFTDAPSSFIYHIKIKGKMYIGQSNRTGKEAYGRIVEHLRAAYYRENNSNWYIQDAEQELHQDMAYYTLSELQIDIYPAPDFGIQNFEQICDEFRQEWRGYPQEPQLIDLAEIFHIQWALTNGISLYNTQMGGQNAGFYPINLGNSNFEEYVKNYNQNTGRSNKDIKLLLRTDSPQVARSKMTKAGAKMQAINLIMKKFYDALFTDQWKTISQTLLTEVDQPLQQKMNMPLVKMTWNEFVTGLLSDGSAAPASLTSFIANQLLTDELKKSLSKKTATSLSAYTHTSQVWKGKMQKYINKNFLQPKRMLLKMLFTEYGRQFNRDFKLDLRLSEEIDNIDFSHLTNYIAQSIFMFTGKGQYKINVDKVKEFTAVNMTASYDLKHSYLKEKGRGWWITRITLISGEPISEEWLKRRSLLMFEHFWQEYKKANPFQDFVTTITQSSSNVTSLAMDNHDIIHMAWTTKEWLSNGLLKVYEKYAPGYVRKWWDFYRPMVEWWKENSVYNEITTFTSANGTEYNGWYYQKQKVYIGYDSYNVLPQKREITIY